MEGAILIYLACKQTFLRFAELDEAIQLQFRHDHDLTMLITAQVDQAVIMLFHFANGELLAFGVTYLLTGLVAHPTQRGIVDGIDTFFIGGRKAHFHTAVGHLQHDAKPEVRFSIAHPALAGFYG